MNERLNAIAERMAAIEAELENASGETLANLEAEVNTLTEERTTIMNDIEKRNNLRSTVAAGAGMKAPAAQQPAAQPSVEETEERSFRDYIFGVTNQMRSNTPQNMSLGNNGAVIPTTIAQRIINKVSEVCPILEKSTLFRVKGKLEVPVYGKATDGDANEHDITVAYATEFVDLTADSGKFTAIELNGYLMGALTLVSRSLQNNSQIDVVSFVIDEMARKIAKFVEGELIAGTGADNNHCTGALSTTTSMNAGSTSAISADNLIDLQAKIPTVYQNESCWIMAPATFTAIKKLKYADGRYIVSEDYTKNFPYTLLGKPVYLSDNMPAIGSANKAVLYGDLSGLGVNIHEDISIEILREKYATQHALGVVAWLEIDSKVLDNQKLATLVMSAG